MPPDEAKRQPHCNSVLYIECAGDELFEQSNGPGYPGPRGLYRDAPLGEPPVGMPLRAQGPKAGSTISW